MGRPQRVGDLDISCDLEHERREWRFQRIGWTIMLIVAAAALAGLLGPGPFSRTEAGDGRLRVSYDRVARYQAPGELRIHCSSDERDQINLWFDRTLIESREIREISPEPIAQSLAGDRYVYHFRSRPDTASNEITIRFESNEFGKIGGSLGIEDGPSLKISQFFWP